MAGIDIEMPTNKSYGKKPPIMAGYDQVQKYGNRIQGI